MNRAHRQPGALLCTGVLLLGWLGGCTAHGEDEPERPAEPQPPPEPERLEVVPPEPVPPPANTTPTCVRIGPVTPLRLKPRGGALGDVTEDGHPDVLALSWIENANSALVLLEGQADGSFVEGPPQPVEGDSIELGDLDGDGDLDALILDARRRPAYRVAINDGTGSMKVGAAHRIPGRFGGELDMASLVDLDGDGDLDAVVPLWDSLRVLRGRGDGRFDPGQRLTVGRDPFSVAVADLDGDGHLDVVTTSGAGFESKRDAYHSANSSVWVHRGGRRGLASVPEGIGMLGASQVAVADLDGDGVLQIVVTRASGISVFRGPQFGPSSKKWRAGDQTGVEFKLGTDGPLLVADLGLGPGPELITSSYMLARLNIVSRSAEPQISSIEAGSFVVGLYSADISHDETLPDVVMLNAGPPGEPYGEPAPSISTLLVDCPRPDISPPGA